MNEKKIIHWVILFILIITPLLFFTDLTRNPYHTQITLLNVALIFAVFVAACAALMRGNFIWRKTPLDISLFLFLGIASLSIAWAWISHPYFRYPIYSETVKRWIYLVVNCYAAYYVAVHYINDDNRKMYLNISIAVAMVAAGYGIIQYLGVEIIWPKVLNPFGGRSVSTFGNPNFLSSFLVLILPVSIHYMFDAQHQWKLKSGDWITVIVSAVFVLYLFLTQDRRDPSVDSVIGCCVAAGIIVAAWKLQVGKAWYLLGNFLFIGSLLCSLTRSSWMGACVALGVYGCGLIKIKKIDKRVLTVLVVLVVLTVYFWPRGRVGGGYGPSVADRFLEIKKVKEGTYAPVHQRLLIWRCALSMTEQFPVIGVGWGNFELFYPYYQGRHMIDSFFKQFRTHANNTHNEILEIVSQVGITGFGIYILMLFCSCVVLWKNRSFLFARYGLLPLALFAGAMGMYVDNLLNVSLHFAVPGFQHWWQLGILMGLFTCGVASIRIKTKLSKTLAYGVLAWCVLLIIRAIFFQIAEVHFFKGFKFSKKGNLNRAVTELEAARKFHRLEVNNNYELGNCYARLKNRTKALLIYKEAMKSNAGYDEIYFNMGAVYLQQKDNEHARGMYERALSINPLVLESYLALGNIYLEDLKTYGQKLTQLYRQGLTIFPDNKDIWNNLGYVYTQAGKHEDAMDCYAEALSIDPGFTLARRNLTVALKATGKKSHPLLEKENTLQEIDALVKKQDYSQALVNIQKLLKNFPDDIRTLIYLGNIHFSLGTFDKAEETYKKILEQDTRNINALNNLGSTYIKLRNKEEALRQFETVLTIDSNNKIAKENVSRLKK